MVIRAKEGTRHWLRATIYKQNHVWWLIVKVIKALGRDIVQLKCTSITYLLSDLGQSYLISPTLVSPNISRAYISSHLIGLLWDLDDLLLTYYLAHTKDSIRVAYGYYWHRPFYLITTVKMTPQSGHCAHFTANGSRPKKEAKSLFDCKVHDFGWYHLLAWRAVVSSLHKRVNSSSRQRWPYAGLGI